VFFSCLKDHSTKKLGSWAKKCVLQPANGRTDGQTDTHESVKSVKMQISKNKNMCIFLMSQVSLNSKIRFLSQKVCPVARSQTDRHTDRVTTEGTLSGFHDFFLQPIIKDRPNSSTTKGRQRPYANGEPCLAGPLTVRARKPGELDRT